MKRRLIILALAGVLTMTSLTGCGGIKDDQAVATVDGDEISTGLANYYARMMQAQYETYYASYLGDDMWTQEVSDGETYEDMVKDQVMNDLQEMYLLEDHMKDYDITISDDEKKSIQEAAKKFEEANEKEAKDKVSGSAETVERFLTLVTIQKKVGDAIRETADMNVSDEEAAKKSMKYVEFSFDTTDESGNSQTLSDDEKKVLKEQAEAFAANAKASAGAGVSGEEFAAFVSEQGYTAADASFDAKETAAIPEELAKAADALGEGEVTDVIETDKGYYVAKVTSTFDRDATDENKEAIIAQRKQDKYSDTLKAWKKDADISVKKNVWKKIDFKTLQITLPQEEEETAE